MGRKHMQYMNYMPVEQYDQFYQIYLPQGLLITRMLRRPDGQILRDAQALNSITKTLRIYWDIYPPRKSGR